MYQSQSELCESRTHSDQITESTQSRDKDLELVIEARDRVVAENQKMLSEKKSLNDAHVQEVPPFFRSHLIFHYDCHGFICC